MVIETVQLFAKYNAATNRKMNAILSSLTVDQWKKEFGGFFKSVEALCNHIYIADFNWLKRLSGLRSFSYIKAPLFDRSIAFDQMLFGNVDEYISMRDELDEQVTGFAGELRNDDLAMDLKYLDSRGNEFAKNFGGLIMHMLNHQTHHRAMISLYLEEMGIANDYSSLSGLL